MADAPIVSEADEIGVLQAIEDGLAEVKTKFLAKIQELENAVQPQVSNIVAAKLKELRDVATDLGSVIPDAAAAGDPPTDPATPATEPPQGGAGDQAPPPAEAGNLS